MNEVWIALISAVLGGVGLKVIDTFFLSKGKQADIAAEFRDELREEMKVQKQEIKELTKEVEKCKARCWRLLEIMAIHHIEIPEDLKHL